MSTHDTTEEITVIGTAELEWLNDRAIKAKRNRALSKEGIEALDPTGIHLITYAMLHNDVEFRLSLMLKMKDTNEPVIGWLDISFEDFHNLPKIKKDADGNWTLVARR